MSFALSSSSFLALSFSACSSAFFLASLFVCSVFSAISLPLSLFAPFKYIPKNKASAPSIRIAAIIGTSAFLNLFELPSSPFCPPLPLLGGVPPPADPPPAAPTAPAPTAPAPAAAAAPFLFLDCLSLLSLLFDSCLLFLFDEADAATPAPTAPAAAAPFLPFDLSFLF